MIPYARVVARLTNTNPLMRYSQNGRLNHQSSAASRRPSGAPIKNRPLSSHAHGDFFRLGELEGPPESGCDDFEQTIPNVLFLPEILLHILDPLEIRDDHAP